MDNRTMSRQYARWNVRFLLLLALIAMQSIASSAGASSGEAPRPNIIFLLTDDQRADTLSVAGHAHVQTPHIDELARRGLRYSNAFTVQPICAPSRFAFLSGQYERSSGLGFNSPYQISDAQWALTYPALLRDAGYHTGFIGKFGVQYYTLSGGAAAQFDYWRAHDGWLPFFPKSLPSNPATAIYRDAKHDITTEIMGESMERFLKARPADKPFMLSVSFSSPHNSVVSSMYPDGADTDCDSYACRVMGYAANGNPHLKGHPTYDTLYRDRSIRPHADTGEDPHRFIPQGIIDHDARQQWYAYNYDAALEPEHLVRYYQNVTGVDRVVGTLMQQLQSLGLDDNTIIIFSSDHGLLNGEYGTGGKALLYDLVAKIPLIVYDPRPKYRSAPAVLDDLVLSIDVPKTILAYAGIDAPASMEGRNLLSSEPARTEVFLESLTVAEGNPFIEALRTQRWKYVRYFETDACPYKEEALDFSPRTPDYEQLFDLDADPGERNNLVDAPSQAAVLTDLRARTQIRSQRMTEQGRRYKTAMAVPAKTQEQIYCW